MVLRLVKIALFPANFELRNDLPRKRKTHEPIIAHGVISVSGLALDFGHSLALYLVWTSNIVHHTAKLRRL